MTFRSDGGLVRRRFCVKLEALRWMLADRLLEMAGASFVHHGRRFDR